jgi:pSer/pThr/pTyr-binding forkhead associated (FHA) protein
MKAKLISREHGEFVFGQQATIGRTEGSTVRLDTAVISSEHARITFDPQRSAYVLEDLDSLNGTQLDGVHIERQEFLGKMHVINFGGSQDFIFQLLSVEADTEFDTIDVPPVGKTQVGGEVPVLPAALREAGADHTAGTGAQEDAGGTRIEEEFVSLPEVLAEFRAGAAPKEDAGPALALEFVLKEEPLRFLLKEGENVVGRSATADIRIDVRDLSRRHATVTVSKERVLVRDEGSRNQTFVGGKRIDQEVEVPVGEQIVFGRLEARLVSTADVGD